MTKTEKKILHDYMRAAHSGRDFLNWFEQFVGKETFAEITCDELTALRDSLAVVEYSHDSE